MANNTLSVTDNRTGKKYELPIEEGDVIRAADLRQIKVGKDDFGLMSYDPAFTNTASCRSRITYIDGDKGILRYRGYPIEELAEKSNYLEVAYLIVKGELPDQEHYERWENNIKIHTMVHENIKKFMEGYRYDAHPMGMLLGTVGALSTFYPDANDIHDLESRRLQTRRLIGKMPTLAAFAYRHTKGLPYVYPDNELSYTGNLLSMLMKMTELQYKPDPVLERALDVLFILHADHEQNCSANAMRAVGSSQPDPYACAAAAVAALYGPLHGGANEAAIRMLMEIGSVSNIPAMIRKVKEGERQLMGFGHRVYKNYWIRAAKILKRDGGAGVRGDGAQSADRYRASSCSERIALQDDYFISHKLYPNVDFYSGIIYQAMGFPMTTCSRCCSRYRGPRDGWRNGPRWCRDPEQKADMRWPRQIYVGESIRHYTALASRAQSRRSGKTR